MGMNRKLLLALGLLLSAASPAAAAPVGPFDVNMADRESVRRSYYSVYQASEGVAIGWTGDVSRCDPGTVSAEYLDATLARINYFRALAGVPSDVTFSAANNAQAQATALIMSARRGMPETVSHDPPSSWKCWTELGRDGARISNLAGGLTGPAGIDALVKDGTYLGHRRTMLNPQIRSMGSGSIPDNVHGNAVEAQLMIDNPAPPAELQPVRDGFVAWPPKGFVPYNFVYPLWSFSLRGADFSNASVAMRHADGTPVAATVTHRNDFAGPGVVWSASDGAWPRPERDDAITVTINHVIVAGVVRDFTYTVTVFDPALGDPARTPLVISGSAQPNRYSVNEIPNAIGYQWQSGELRAFELNDGAEAGLAHFDAVVGGYEPIDRLLPDSGESAFRLSIGHEGGAAGSGPQTLTLKQTLVPSADTQLTLRASPLALENVRAQIEVSDNDGESWSAIYTEPSSDDGYKDIAVSLAPFAGRQVRLRFRVAHAGTGAWTCCSAEGWYLDEIKLRNVQAVFAAVLSEPSTSTSFDFTPSAGALHTLKARAQFFGSGFGPWSSTLEVTAK